MGIVLLAFSFFGLIGVCSLGPLLDLAFGVPVALAILIGYFTGAFPLLVLTNLYRLSIYHGIPDSYDFLRRRAEEYYSLSKKERSEYPAGIIKILRNADNISSDQREVLNLKLKILYASICEREQVRNQFVNQGVDITDILDSIDDTCALIESDTETFREFS